MEMRHLRYFLAAAQTGHMTQAAELLGIQQPPLSQQIKNLERELGVPLFTRHARGLRLTQAGLTLQKDARRLVDEFQAMQAHMRRYLDGSEGTVSVGFTSSSAAHAFTPLVLRRCRRKYPSVQLVVSENHAAAITEAVASAQLDCGFVRASVAWPEHVVQHVLLSEPMWLALPRDHALLNLGGSRRAPASMPLTALQDQAFIFVRRPEAPGLYANFEQACAARQVRIRVTAEVDRMMTALNLVAAGVGLTIVPESMRSVHRHAITFVRLDKSVALAAPLTLIYREDEDHGPVGSFIALVKQLAVSKAEALAASPHPDPTTTG
ncbi:LysR family transcriptional regulator [Comamonas serinivorans]|uniref:LysR family transcriptional regulator n=1 Tax=Comamonas serinivorans TaxID=1082851 RepID=A0A1Y0ET18_9BURK|nr:LysR family transcriptional regulator [Comamonas serinivorans]ARU06726.1 LysR family transcriptional regulator [Comamonas serinivorans]